MKIRIAPKKFSEIRGFRFVLKEYPSQEHRILLNEYQQCISTLRDGRNGINWLPGLQRNEIIG